MTNRQLENPLNEETKRRYVRIAAFVVLGAAIGILLATGAILPQMPIVNVVPLAEEPNRAGNAYTLPGSEPASLSIPGIGLQATFEEPLGLNPDRSPEVPESFTEVGWYKYSPTPGELGPSVVLGHVDSHEGPAVFFSIGQLERNDPIEITREDGSVATFRVTGIERYEQEGFPRELVYGDIDHAGLRLVTCSGSYDRQTNTYSHNTVVYAELVEPGSATTTPAAN